MDFQELLNDYIELFSCTAKELADASGLTAVDISRYRTGKRTPDLSSPQLKKLAFGLAKLAQEHGKESITEGEIYNALTNALGKESLSYAITIERFNQIISLLDINISQMARVLNYDASYISRIRSKQRRPSDMHSFFHSVSVFIVRSYSDTASKELIANVLDCDIQHLEDNSSYLYLLESWFFSDSEDMELSGSSANDFLRKLDEFNLDEYIRSIHFNDIKVPSVPFQFATSKNYFGLEAMKNGELDFLKSTVLSKSTESVYMCSDMPMEDMAQDLEFGKKWMFGLAVMLKKGLHLNIIHVKLPLCKRFPSLITKKRYKIPYQSYMIELDIFEGELASLQLAEVEFPTKEEAEAFEAPEWFGEDVTFSGQYQNSSLSKRKKK